MYLATPPVLGNTGKSLMLIRITLWTGSITHVQQQHSYFHDDKDDGDDVDDNKRERKSVLSSLDSESVVK